MTSPGRRNGLPPRRAGGRLELRRCSLRARRALGQFARDTAIEAAERRGRPLQAR